MEIDPAILANYRNLLVNTKQTLAHNQFQDFVRRVDISPTKRLERSYHSLFKAIDKYPLGDFAKILNHRFLFEVLNASPKKRERDLRRIAVNYCDFIQSAGSGNTQGHRSNVTRIAQQITACIKELQELDFDKKDENFHTLWIGELRERLDTRDDK
tara:strand:- start:4910 stop:5377 length:468 start_codon:yes stop_codon:yes gene_type:complete